LYWSDNLLAERLARLSARAAGYSFNEKGVEKVFKVLLSELQINSSKLVIDDASGLSRQNRITAGLMAELLFKMRKEEKFAAIYDLLPVGGVSGTLEDRFKKTAPGAVGLVRAKTGTLNGTVTMAGFVQSTDREYVFVVLADRIKRGYYAQKTARVAIDQILGRIAAPNLPIEIIPAL
jgi:PBP4 family serine-type D-alanyl-D-alanine carboxypeptidase